MSCEVETRDGIVYIRGEMTIYDAAALKASLFAALDGEPKVVINLAGVSELDTSGLQLLMMARRVSAARSVPFSIAAPSEVVNESLALLRVSDWNVTAPTVVAVSHRASV